jgi:hypothetical protein
MGRVMPKHQDEEFVRGFLQQTKHTEDDHGVLVEVELAYTGRAGVMAILLIAVESRETHNLSRPVVRYRSEYPTAHVASLAGALYQAACRIDLMVAEYRATEAATHKPLWG